MPSLHWLRQFAGKWFADCSTANRPNQRDGRRPYRPTVEILEDRLAPASITTLASFNSPVISGQDANYQLLADAKGNLFGTTSGGGKYNYGTVFEVKAGSNTVTILASFDGNASFYPNGPLVEDSAGDLFGTTSGDYGPPNPRGTVFEVKAGSGVITTLATFNVTSGGPNGGLVLDASGNLYGTTPFGSGNLNDPGVFTGTGVGGGTVFELKAGSSTIITLASFDGTNGASPGGLIGDATGNLFGITDGGGANGFGTVFEMNPSSGTITTLANFDTHAGNLTIDPHGNLFGTLFIPVPNPSHLMIDLQFTSQLFEVKAGSGTITTFAGPDPFLGAFVVDGNDNLFGTGVGAYGHGSVVEWNAGTDTRIVLASFNGTNGANPNNNLIRDANGDIIGTTMTGGANNSGTIFQVAPFANLEAAFIHGVYGQLLHRAPDSGGLAYWSNLLSNGVAPSTVVLDIENGTEYMTDEVSSLYFRFLGREADPAGLHYWVNQLAGGARIEQVTAFILASPEYFSNPWRNYERLLIAQPVSDPLGTNADFVEALYYEVLGRQWSAAEVQGWVNALNGGMTRFQAASDFLASPEYRTHLVNSYYLQFLGRAADAGGLAGWVQALQAGASDQAVLAAIFGSDEGFAEWS